MTHKSPKPPSESPALKVVMQPKHTNHQGAIFGGVILSLIDQAAWVEALRQCSRRYVSVAMDKVEFKQPVYQGDILSLWGRTVSIGTTSIRVHINVRAFRPELGDEIAVTQAEVVLVSVDESGKPTPIAQ